MSFRLWQARFSEGFLPGTPYDFVKPRAVLISDVRARTSPARARMTVRSACAFRLRCCYRPQQTRVDSRQPGQRAGIAAIIFSTALSIKRTFRAWATITSCPNSLNSRLTHGECIPVSNASRLRSIPLNLAGRALGFFFCNGKVTWMLNSMALRDR